MKHLVTGSALILFISLLSITNTVAEENPITLRADNTTITLTKNEPVIIDVYASDWTRLNGNISRPYVYFDNRQDELQRNPYFRVEYASVSAEKQSYQILIAPGTEIKNGTYNFALKIMSSQPLNFTVVINIDPSSENLYTLNFNLSCPSPDLNTVYRCTITPKIEGAGKNLAAGKYSISYSSSSIGSQNWKVIGNLEWDIQKAVISTFGKLTKPINIKAKIAFNGKNYELTQTVKPKTQITFFAPGAAIVGESFKVTAIANKNYSGNCVVNNYSMQFTIKNGNGSILIYGQTPGNLNLYIACKSSKWADTGGSKFVYIRP